MESKLLIRCHVQQDGILFLRQVVIGFGHSFTLTQIDHLQVPCRRSAMVIHTQSF